MTPLLFILWIVFCFGTASMAGRRNRSKFAWFFLALFLSPVVAILLLLLFGNAKPSQDDLPQKRKCPFCAEEILADAIVCKYCGRDIKETVDKIDKEKQENEVVELIRGHVISFNHQKTFFENPDLYVANFLKEKFSEISSDSYSSITQKTITEINNSKL